VTFISGLKAMMSVDGERHTPPFECGKAGHTVKKTTSNKQADIRCLNIQCYQTARLHDVYTCLSVFALLYINARSIAAQIAFIKPWRKLDIMHVMS
jgi:hypothetical protein